MCCEVGDEGVLFSSSKPSSARDQGNKDERDRDPGERGLIGDESDREEGQTEDEENSGGAF